VAERARREHGCNFDRLIAAGRDDAADLGAKALRKLRHVEVLLEVVY
jgi:hypothetical protein